METAKVLGESRYLEFLNNNNNNKKKTKKKRINKLTNVNYIKFGKAFSFAKKTAPSLDDNIKTLAAVANLI